MQQFTERISGPSRRSAAWRRSVRRRRRTRDDRPRPTAGQRRNQRVPRRREPREQVYGVHVPSTTTPNPGTTARRQRDGTNIALRPRLLDRREEALLAEDQQTDRRGPLRDGAKGRAGPSRESASALISIGPLLEEHANTARRGAVSLLEQLGASSTGPASASSTPSQLIFAPTDRHRFRLAPRIVEHGRSRGGYSWSGGGDVGMTLDEPGQTASVRPSCRRQRTSRLRRRTRVRGNPRAFCVFLVVSFTTLTAWRLQSVFRPRAEPFARPGSE